MQATVNVSKEILEWVMECVRLEILPTQIVNYLNSWLSGDKTPTYNQIEKVSKATGIPLGYFFLQTPPEEDVSLLNYRTVDSISLNTPSRNLMDTIHDMEQVQDWMHQYQLSVGEGKLSFVGAMSEDSTIPSVVSMVRHTLGLNEDWFRVCKDAEEAFRKIRQSISEAGVVVMMNGIVGNNTHRPLEINEFRAFAIVDEYAPLIFINSNDSINGRLFSLLHEFAHICLGMNSFFNDRHGDGNAVSKTEKLCNGVAAEILVPHQLFLNEWANSVQNLDAEHAIDVLAKVFRCGITVIARRALDSGFIDKKLYQKIAKLAIDRYNESRQKKKENPGGSYYRTAASRIDQRFFKLLRGSVVEGKTLYSDAFRLTHTNRSTYAELSDQLGGGRIG